MAKNDVILLDGILDDRVSLGIPSKKRDEAFEYLAIEQILKDYDLSSDDLSQGFVDGKDDGGIDGFYIFVNGHFLSDCSSFFWPKTSCELEIYLITCKHHDTFKQSPLDSLVASLSELFNFSINEKELKGDYNSDVLEKRKNLISAYRKLSSKLTKFNIRVCYASRGDTTSIGDNIIARANQIKAITKDFFSVCNVSFEFIGATEILILFRKSPEFSLELPFDEVLSQGERYILLSKIKSYFNFIIDEDKKLRRYLFDSNVRDYMGLNRVNEDIMNTLESNNTPDFWWLNNGITILATSASVIGKSIHIENVQIVNGLQTSESIYKYFQNGGKDDQERSLLVKVIVSNEADVRDSIIRATNNQTNVELSSLHATDKIQRDIEDMMLRYGLYYERRANHYLNQGVESSSLITPLYLAAGYVNLILKSPYSAAHLKSRFMRSQEQYQRVFSGKFPLQAWPVIAKIMRKTDEILEQNRANNNFVNERYLKNWRQITAFISVSRLVGKFDFDSNELLQIDLDEYNDELIKSSWNLISIMNGNANNSKNSKNWKKKSFFDNMCKQVSQEDNITGYESIVKWKNAFKSMPENVASIDEDFIETVNEILPEQPWKPQITKRVAKSLNCSSFLVSKAIEILIERKLRYRQKDGIVYDDNGNILMIDKERVDLSHLDKSI